MESQEFYLHIVAISKMGEAPFKQKFGPFPSAEEAMNAFGNIERRDGFEYNAKVSPSLDSK
jgi:hypothetical protein